jgi:two-component system, cell cycle response regulator DivK
MAANKSDRTILLVEDNDDNRAIYSTILRHYGYTVEEVTTGPQALEVARRVLPDLILLDISLPEMDGWTVAERLKGDEATRGIVIVALTAHALPEDQRRAQELGCDAFLPKPVRPRRVLEEVERLTAE